MESHDEQIKNNNAPVKVMLADANLEDQKVFKEAIKEGQVNAKLTITNDGDALMKNLKDVHIPNPDVIFLDVDMPGKTGVQCLDEIKHDDNLKDIPTIMYTASENEKDVNETFKGGANLFVTKPIFFRNLVYLLRKIIKMTWQGILLKPFRKNFVLTETEIQDSGEIMRNRSMV